MGTYDVAVPGDYMVEIMANSGMLDTFSPDEMSNFGNIMDQWVDVSFDPGRKSSIPYQWGSTSFSVNRDVYSGDIQTTDIIFNPPEELKGKINKFYFNFLIFLHTGLSQEYLPTSQISLITVRENRDFSPDLIASYANQLVFVDKKNHAIGIYSNDSLRIVGGYGSSEYSFIDPVDVIIDNLAIMILDESAGRVTKFDLNLNFIRLYNLKSNDPIYSKVFDIDSRQNIYFHSVEDGILYQRKNEN